MVIMYLLLVIVYLLWWWTGHDEILTFKLNFYLEGQGQSLPKTIENLTKVFCTSDPNLVILASTGDEI